MTEDSPNLRRLPSVDRVLGLPAIQMLCERQGRSVVTAWIRDVLGSLRNGESAALPADAASVTALVVGRVLAVADRTTAQRLRKVINGTGIVIHTNLGRAPLAQAAIDAIRAAAECTNVEVNLSTGARDRRGAAVEQLCRDVTGAEAALVVNNCAAATLLALQTLAAGREVIISRGQLIEIGGAFRLPDVFRQAGVTLREVGTTNRTRLADYAGAISSATAGILRVHPSNYRVTGFCESVGITELVELGRKHNLPVIDDVGSGCLYNLSRHGLPDEPMIGASVRAGASLVLCSGDKLLGGPQSGIIVGRAELVDRLRSHPLARALRVDKLTLAALQATLEIHRAGRAFDEIPVLRQLSLKEDELHECAEQVLQRLKSSTTPVNFAAESVASASGGGALPELAIASWAIAIRVPGLNDLARRLRMGSPPVLPRVQGDRLLVDLRTVCPREDELLIECILAAVQSRE